MLDYHTTNGVTVSVMDKGSRFLSIAASKGFPLLERVSDESCVAKLDSVAFSIEFEIPEGAKPPSTARAEMPPYFDELCKVGRLNARLVAAAIPCAASSSSSSSGAAHGPDVCRRPQAPAASCFGEAGSSSPRLGAIAPRAPGAPRAAAAARRDRMLAVLPYSLTTM